MEQINIEDFAKIEMKVGEIISCEEVPDSYKLLKFEVDLGNEKRQILSGIKKFYNPEDLLHKKIIVITNLKPAIMAGLESNGMLLCADMSSHHVKVVEMDPEIPNGTIIR